MEEEIPPMAVRPQDRPDAAAVHDNEDTEEEQIVVSGDNSRKLPYVVVVVVVPVGNNEAAGAVLANDGRLLPEVVLYQWYVHEVFDRTCTFPTEQMLLSLSHLFYESKLQVVVGNVMSNDG
jgi:hypothetical protein